MGPRGSAAETAFATCLTNNKDGFTTLLALVAPNLMCKPATVLFNKVTIKGAKQAVQMFGPAQHAVAKAVADSVADGTIPQNEADDIFICVGVFIHWDAEDNKKIQDFNYRVTKEAISRAVSGWPSAAETVAKKDKAAHPFAARSPGVARDIRCRRGEPQLAPSKLPALARSSSAGPRLPSCSADATSTPATPIAARRPRSDR